MEAVMGDRTSAGRPRARLSRERVVSAGVGLADRDGLGALTMRSLADELGVRPMALYRHVAHKEELLDALVDAVFDEIVLMTPGEEWRDELTRRCRSMRAALGRHSWSLALMETRSSPGPATLEHHENVLEVLRTAGFSVPATAHAYAVVDAFVYGFALQEAELAAAGLGEAEQTLSGIPLEKAPRMAELAQEHVLAPGYDFGDSFEVGLTIVLDGLERLRHEL
ncbi:TetR/AcrR family transcriptional regulator C-terminal domain-containing protein [Georgenia sp. Z1344]|uniref:TetR/AcrR family transcriptional regulator C-terminal domain-containing protein n=1 Tax=Georgenia sp. Z1344 TaxID=3416706 RepID=UPI003CF56A9A